MFSYLNLHKYYPNDQKTELEMCKIQVLTLK